jgi:BirA family biotin operon repressor/biotin-[acetyl-CoA-carboxylase] ligase
MHQHLHEYNKSNLPVARVLRKAMTDAERKLWSHLRKNQLSCKFRRQFPIGKYVLDFYSPQIKLNIEIDGGQHYTEEGKKRDQERDQYLKTQGIEVLRFADNEVFQNEDGVLNMIYDKIESRKKMRPHPNLPLKGEGAK